MLLDINGIGGSNKSLKNRCGQIPVWWQQEEFENGIPFLPFIGAPDATITDDGIVYFEQVIGRPAIIVAFIADKLEIVFM